MSLRPLDPSAPLLDVDIESLDLDAQGVAHHEGKVVFVRGALPGERVRAALVRRKPRFDVAQTVSVLRESFSRVTPRCPHFGVCGGCSMQHLEERAQLAVKQRALEDQFRHLAGLRPETMLRPMAGPAWGYRQRARLSVRHVVKKGGVLVGFHERNSSYVADMRECAVLPPAVSGLLMPLRSLVEGLSIRDRMPQIEVAVGEDSLALVFRVLQPPSPDDRALLSSFARTHRLELWLQPKGPDSVELLCNGAAGPDAANLSSLHYRLDEFSVVMPFLPTDFTQVNHQINRSLVHRVVGLLDPRPHERIADLFCGLGNFSLPLARRAAFVVGVEGSRSLCERARDNAGRNGLGGKTRFEAANLFELDAPAWDALGPFDGLLIDPPREGALAVARCVAASPRRLRRIVYVSCNPATLARDAAVLVHEGSYRLTAAAAINMFPQTSHVESIAVFEPAEPSAD